MRTIEASLEAEKPKFRASKYETGPDGRVLVYQTIDGQPIRVYPVDADEQIALGQARLSPVEAVGSGVHMDTSPTPKPNTAGNSSRN